MNLFSLRRLKLFRQPLSTPPQKTILPSSEQGGGKTPGSSGFKFLLNPFVFLFLFVFIIAYILSYTPSKTLPLLKPGDIAGSDVVAPIDLTIEDTETTQKRLEEAEQAVLPVYTLDLNTFLNTEDKIRIFFALGRDWVQSPPPKALPSAEMAAIINSKTGIEIQPKELEAWRKTGFSPAMELALIESLGRVFNRGVLRSKALFLRGESERGFTIIQPGAPEKSARLENVLDLKEARQMLSTELEKVSLPPSQRELLLDLGGSLLSPNLSFNRVETERRKQEARNQVGTVFYRIKKGKVIIRKGDEATPEAIKLISFINQNLERRSSWGKNFLGNFLLFGLLLLTVWFYLKSLLAYKLAFNRFLLIGTLLFINLLLGKLSLSLASIFSAAGHPSFLSEISSYYYALPYQMATLIITFLTTSHLALVLAIINSLLAGFLLQSNFSIMLYAFVGSLAAIYGIKFYGRKRRSSSLKAGVFLVSPINIFLTLIFFLSGEAQVPPGQLAAQVFMAAMGGLLSGILAYLLLPLFENVFAILTEAKLVELTNSDLPIFRQMALEAPGSYHHSLIVATLAEKAAETIKLDPLLVRAGALYHDIGKIKRPEYFIENVTQRENAHQELTPQLSALVIINHVKDGLELARKLRLPEKIKEIIAQHHGNSLVRYFYEKAKEKYDPALHQIGEETYRYPGPPPQSKEAAIILLADSVEAASRSLSSPHQENLKRMIKDIFETYIDDGQLDQCELTFREIRKIAVSFLATLDMVYHPRPKYPDFDFEGKKRPPRKKREKNHGRNNQPAK